MFYHGTRTGACAEESQIRFLCSLLPSHIALVLLVRAVHCSGLSIAGILLCRVCIGHLYSDLC